MFYRELGAARIGVVLLLIGVTLFGPAAAASPCTEEDGCDEPCSTKGTDARSLLSCQLCVCCHAARSAEVAAAPTPGPSLPDPRALAEERAELPSPPAPRKIPHVPKPTRS